VIGSLILLGLLTFGLAFLAADASLFGVSAKGYVKTVAEAEEWDDAGFQDDAFSKFEEADQLLETNGLLKIRNRLLRVRFFRELLSCYFCLGLWCGMAAHTLLVAFSRLPEVGQTSYALAHGNSVWAWLGGLFIGGIVAAPLCYGIDLLYGWMEGANG
jgi:hypothetical protein